MNANRKTNRGRVPAPAARVAPGTRLGRWTVVPLLLALTPMGASGQSVPADTLDLAAGSFAEMHMLLQKTIFQVDVLTVRLRFDDEVAARLEALAKGRGLTASVADSIARVALEARDAWAVIEYVRDVKLDQFLGGLRDNMRRAAQAGIIGEQDYEVISAELHLWYAPLEERKVLSGDRIYYRIRGDTVRTVYQGVDGEILLDHTEVGPERRLAVMGGYFAPKSSFRKKLIESLFASRP